MPKGDEVTVVIIDGHPVPLGVYDDWESAARAATEAGQGHYLMVTFVVGEKGKKDINQLFID